MKGNVFDIQRYSIHDGKGIRTVVFLKGCPLRCKWCANPESWTLESQLFYKKSSCIHCHMCIDTCQNSEVTLENNEIKLQKGNYDFVRVCPTEALCVKGTWMTVEEVMREIRKDLPFYKQSNGGVTFSGGEPLLQADFTLALLKQCKAEGISTAVETTGYVELSILDKILPYVDLFLYDVKTMNDEKHQYYTGVSNTKILSNLKYIAKKADIMVRTPMIPNVNDRYEDIQAILNYLKECNIHKYSILPFHQYGSNKYEALQIPYEMSGIAMHDEEYVNDVKLFIKKQGFSEEF